MTLLNFLSKFNWRLMVVHFIACWFLFHALWQLGYLYDYKFLELIVNHNLPDLIKRGNSKEIQAILKDYQDQDISVRMAMDILYAFYAALAGLLIGFVLSVLLSKKYKWFWANSAIVLFMGLWAIFIDRFYWHRVKFIFMFPGIPFKSLWWFNFIGGVFMLIVGLSLFFWKRIIQFIDGAKTSPLAAQ